MDTSWFGPSEDERGGEVKRISGAERVSVGELGGVSYQRVIDGHNQKVSPTVAPALAPL